MKKCLLQTGFLAFCYLSMVLPSQAQGAANPVIFSDVPDLSMIRAGNTYYMSSTTMHMSPGVPVMKSNDLVNWQLVSYAYDTLANVDALNLENGKSTYGSGSWASSIRFHNGTYYISTFAQTTGKTYVFTTKNIEKGPWKVSSFKPSLHDHSLFFDDDGRVYMVYGAGRLKLVELNADVSGIKPGTAEQVIIENASAPAGTNIGLAAEGSQLFKINGKYYLFNITWPRGGMRTVIVHRADRITGPYEGRLALQDKGVAQGGLISTPDGDWYSYLFRDYGAVGRIPYLVPVKWEDGWPVLGVNGKVPDTLNLPASKGYIPHIVASDEFSRKPNEPALPLVWQWNHNPDNRFWSLTKRPGYLRLTTGRVDSSILLARNTLTQRTFGPQCAGTTAVDVSSMKDGDFAGLILLQKNYGWVGVSMDAGAKSIVMVNAGSGLPVIAQRVPLKQKTVYLKADCNFKDLSDKANFYYSLDGKSWIAIGSPLQMRYTLPHFMGYRFGLFNYATKKAGGFADFDFFRITDRIAEENDLKAFPLSSVRLLESPFLQAQQTDLKYILALDTDRLLAPFLREAGLTPKDSSYGNWENTGLDGHTGGHYLSALANMYAATGNQELLQRLHYMIDWLDSCQRKNGDGYVGGVPGSKKMWAEVAAGNIKAGNFSLNGKWVPWYNIHKLYAGLVDAYTITGIQKAKDVLVKLSDWCIGLTKNLTDDQVQQMLTSEHGGMNEVFANVASITGDKKYLDLARRFSHRKILDPLLRSVDSLTGLHANTQIPKVVGFERIAKLSGDKSWGDAAAFFWETVVNRRSVSVGGNSVSEHFNPVSDFSSMMQSREGIETCNSYNMLRLTKDLFLADPQVKYMDYYERTVYNHILSSQHPDGGFVYFTPMRPAHYRMYSQPQKDFWCCVGTGLENHGKYGEMIYAHKGDDIYVNLFIPSRLAWSDNGIALEQNTKFPFEETSRISLQLQKPKQFSLFIRYPHWVQKGALKISVNNQPLKIDDGPGAYIAIDRTWKTGDIVTIKLPMHTKAERLPDGSDWVSFVHGPIVLAAATDTAGLPDMKADGSRMGHVARGPLYPIEDAPVIVTAKKDPGIAPVDKKALTFRITDAVHAPGYKQLKLVPFFQLHDARYMIYWPVSTPQGLIERQKAIHEKEKALLALEKITIDQVAAGQQQPESDHNFKGENTESGIFNDRHYRHARGWFSYDLKDPRREAKKIRVTYSGLDGGRNFDIMINNSLLQTVTLENKGNRFYEVEYEIPEQMKSAEMNVKFVAHAGSLAGGIYHLRLMK